MKNRVLKIAAVLVALLLAVVPAVYAEDAVETDGLLDKIVEANYTESILSDHDSLSVSFTSDDGITKSNSPDYSMYVDKDVFLFSGNNYQEIELPDGTRYAAYANVFGKFVNIGQEQESYFTNEIIIAADTVEETVLDASIDENGMLNVNTEVPIEMLQADGKYSDDIVGCTVKYMVNPDTYVIASTEYTYEFADGTQAKDGITVTLGEPRPEIAQTLMDHAASDDVRVITFIVDPGADDEQTIEVKVMKGDYAIQFINDEIYDAQAYDDAEGTMPHESTPDTSADMVLYVLPAQK